MGMSEPEDLRQGKVFHRTIQDEWLSDTFGAALSEMPVELRSKLGDKRCGRIDVRMLDPDEPIAFVVEVKASNFDRMTDSAVRRNVGRNRLQVSRYGESLLEVASLGLESVCLAIVYSTEPADSERREWIERYLAGYMTATYWHNTERAAPLY
jgi:hypothetical protein